MSRPKRPESWPAFSRRLRQIEGRTFEKVRAMSLALEEDWKSHRRWKTGGSRSAPHEHFAVRFRSGNIEVLCLSFAALHWKRMNWLAKHGFAGLKVRVEDAR